jgi:hypothetical protein
MGRLVINNAMTVNGAFEAPTPDAWLVLDPDSNNVSLLEGDLAESVPALKNRHQGTLVVSGAGAGELRHLEAAPGRR